MDNRNKGINEPARFSEKKPDKRKDLRNHLLVLRVRGESKNKVFFGYAKNISKGGMFISSVNPRKVGEEFIIEFTLPREKKHIQCRCIVEWSRSYKPKSRNEPGMGVRFLDLENDIKKMIDDWVKDSSPFL